MLSLTIDSIFARSGGRGQEGKGLMGSGNWILHGSPCFAHRRVRRFTQNRHLMGIKHNIRPLYALLSASL